MAAFKFGLASVLRVREATRDERRAQLAEAFRAAEKLAERLAELDRDWQDTRKRQTAAVGAVHVDGLLDASRYDAVLQMERRQIEQHQKLVAAEIERRRENLVAADRDVRALEHLRDDQARRAQVDAERRLAQQLDEVAGRDFARREPD